RAVGAQRHAGFFQPQGARLGRAPGGVENLLRFDRAAVGQGRAQSPIGFVDAGNAGGKSQIDAAFAHLFRQRQANIVVEAAQKQIAAVELGGAHAQAVKNPGELDTDVAAADDDDARRRALKKKRFVRSDRVFGAGEIFFHRPAPAGDKNIGRGDFFAV